MSNPPIIDAHFHIFDPRFPLPGNDGYVPPRFTAQDYRAATAGFDLRGGVVVAASTHGLDPAPLVAAMRDLGPGFVAVVNADPDLSDVALRALADAGVRGLRHNLYRGVAASVRDELALAERGWSVAGLHTQVYADAALLRPFADRLATLGPRLVIDHLGMTEAGLPMVLDLVEAGAKVKATGFGRVSLDVPRALGEIARRSASALMFGTDLPSTRAARPFRSSDVTLLREVLGEELAAAALHGNAAAYYRLPGTRREGPGAFRGRSAASPASR
ncbi:amidohydrolase family protein [Teichococcus vastitatis]|uniref:Amidohydrolase family protein n=1 Tax=Teichococcus vastitatis TaxID=2307076 RepID=A0ABS9W815_9PROT|nr:amidohydrolase family protein [Pseudoroseomonas vastitatis]MCI0755168.1 amidohydrolase family protein [Pseudoroseomonas vastitatis]